MQAVGQLDNDNADVLAHGNEHLAEGLRLLVGERFHLDLGDLGNTVHQIGHGLAEQLGYLLFGGSGVFHRIVQKGGDERFHIHVQVGQDDGNLYRVDYERLARLALLAMVHLLGIAEGLFHQRKVILAQIGAGKLLQNAEALFRVGTHRSRSGRLDGGVDR